MAYGMLVSLGLNLRNFEASADCLIGIAIGLMFITLFFAYIVSLFRYPIWFGSFKNKFDRSDFGGYFYVLSSL